MKKTYLVASAALALALALPFSAIAQTLNTATSTATTATESASIPKEDLHPTTKHIRPELLKAYAGALAMDVTALKQELDSGKNLYKTAKSKSMNKRQFRVKVGEQLQAMIRSGELKGAKARFYSQTVNWSKSAANK